MVLVTLTLDYVNHAGDHVLRYLPVYETFAACEYWREYFLAMLNGDHATNIRAACEALK